jgi:peptide/nickel transport system permease protein
MSDIPTVSLGIPAPVFGDDQDSSLSPAQLAWRRFRRNKMAMGAAIILLLLVLMSVVGPLLYKVSPDLVDPRNFRQAPNAAHALGTDSAGRDVLARLMAGGRVSLAIGLIAALISTVIGIALGIVAGYFRGWADSVLTRVAEVFQSFPALIIIIVVVAFLGPSVPLLTVTLGLLQWTAAFRVTRGVTMSLREQDSIQAVEGLGGTPFHILLRHMVPAVLPHATVAFTLLTATVVMTEAGLSFLGLGVPPPTPTWGSMISEAQSLRILETMPWMWLPPGIAIALTVMSVNFVGDGLRDAVDPRQSR